MQKKLIALAVAGLVSAPAFAQSNVTIYGRVDMGYTNFGSSKDGVNVSSRNGIDSGVKDPSFIGFRGVEELGNGLKAGFDLQQRINPENGEYYSSGASARDNILFLSGGFGTVAAGRMTTPQEKLLGSIDPFASANTVAGYGEGYTRGAQLITGGATTRLDNTVAYVSPSFSGLTVTVAYTWDALGQESNGNEGTFAPLDPSAPTDAEILAGVDAQVWAVSPVYKNGPLTLGANYHKVELKSSNAVLNSIEETVWDLAAAYDFGVVKLSAAYGQDKIEGDGDSAKVKQWFVGASAPIGAAGAVQLVYGQAELDESGVDAEIDRWAVGYTHALSKRTTAYAMYGQLDLGNDADLIGFTGYKSAYERGLGLGVQHRF
ncbi:porin [Thauera sp. ZXT1-4]|uniref:porin n=1 Tax=Thauera sp. ZXT1-4 TaxID=3460294 RepID=UPI00404077EE